MDPTNPLLKTNYGPKCFIGGRTWLFVENERKIEEEGFLQLSWCFVWILLFFTWDRPKYIQRSFSKNPNSMLSLVGALKKEACDHKSQWPHWVWHGWYSYSLADTSQNWSWYCCKGNRENSGQAWWWMIKRKAVFLGIFHAFSFWIMVNTFWDTFLDIFWLKEMIWYYLNWWSFSSEKPLQMDSKC